MHVYVSVLAKKPLPHFNSVTVPNVLLPVSRSIGTIQSATCARLARSQPSHPRRAGAPRRPGRPAPVAVRAPQHPARHTCFVHPAARPVPVHWPLAIAFRNADRRSPYGSMGRGDGLESRICLRLLRLGARDPRWRGAQLSTCESLAGAVGWNALSFDGQVQCVASSWFRPRWSQLSSLEEHLGRGQGLGWRGGNQRLIRVHGYGPIK